MASCVDTVILPYDKTVDEDFWQTKTDVTQMVYGSYVKMSNEAFIQRLITWGSFRSDELLLVNSINNGTRNALLEIEEVNIETNNMFSDWSSVYSVINNCNIVLERAEKVMSIDPSYTEGDYLTDRSQMLTLRALCYFYLVRTFRDVPYTSTAYMNSSQNMTINQLAPDSVLKLCIADLEEAEKNALAPVVGVSQKINKDGIQAILADIYLWRASVMHNPEDYRKCVEYCDMIITSKTLNHIEDANSSVMTEYPLTDDPYRAHSLLYGKLDQNIAEEIIFDIVPRDNSGLQKFYDQYEKDKSSGYVRASAVFGSVSSNGAYTTINDTRYWLNTYAVGSGATTYDIRKMIFDQDINRLPTTGIAKEKITFGGFERRFILYKLSDVMLMKAEAMVQLAADNKDVILRNAFNIVQYVNRRALANESTGRADSLRWNTYANDRAKMETLVLQERLRELCFEGKRWYDLLRYNFRHVEGIDYTTILADQAEAGASFVQNTKEMLDLVVRKYTDGGDARKAKMRTEPYLYMPIPRSDIEVSSNLKQNPVYKDNDRFEQNK